MALLKQKSGKETAIWFTFLFEQINTTQSESLDNKPTSTILLLITVTVPVSFHHHDDHHRRRPLLQSLPARGVRRPKTAT